MYRPLPTNMGCMKPGETRKANKVWYDASNPTRSEESRHAQTPQGIFQRNPRHGVGYLLVGSTWNARYGGQHCVDPGRSVLHFERNSTLDGRRQDAVRKIKYQWLGPLWIHQRKLILRAQSDFARRFTARAAIQTLTLPPRIRKKRDGRR